MWQDLNMIAIPPLPLPRQPGLSQAISVFLSADP